MTAVAPTPARKKSKLITPHRVAVTVVACTLAAIFLYVLSIGLATTCCRSTTGPFIHFTTSCGRWGASAWDAASSPWFCSAPFIFIRCGKSGVGSEVSAIRGTGSIFTS